MANPQIVIPISPDFLNAMNTFMANVQKFQVQAQQNFQSLPHVQLTKAQVAQSGVATKLKHTAQLFAKLSRTFQREIDRILNTMGSFGKAFMKSMSFESLAARFGPVGLGVAGVVITAKAAFNLVIGGAGLAKWLWDAMVGLGDSMLQDWLLASGTLSTVGGVRAFRTTFAGLPDDPNILPSVMRAQANRTSRQFLAMQILGVQNIKNSADLAVEMMLAAQKFMKAQKQGTELFMAEKFGLTALFNPQFLISLKNISEEDLREKAKLYEKRKGMFEITEKAVEGWKNFVIQVKKAGVQITNIIAEKLADPKSDLVKAFTELSKAIVKFVKTFLEMPISKDLVDNLVRYANQFTDWLKSEGPSKNIKTVGEEIKEIVKALKTAKKAVGDFGSLFGFITPAEAM
ncbi:MAG TPA: hypothetical protein VGG71_01515, partial [Chitinophagaceae bacterium]